jgi:hypothetical protein
VRITITQRGGLAGGEITLTQVDTATLNPEARKQVEAQVAASMTGSRPPVDRAIGADLLEYTLTVEQDGGEAKSAWVDDGGAGAQPIKQLLTQLQHVRT